MSVCCIMQTRALSFSHKYRQFCASECAYCAYAASIHLHTDHTQIRDRLKQRVRWLHTDHTSQTRDTHLGKLLEVVGVQVIDERVHALPLACVCVSRSEHALRSDAQQEKAETSRSLPKQTHTEQQSLSQSTQTKTHRKKSRTGCPDWWSSG